MLSPWPRSLPPGPWPCPAVPQVTLAPPELYPHLYPYTWQSCGGNDMEGEMYRFSEVRRLRAARQPRAARSSRVMHQRVLSLLRTG